MRRTGEITARVEAVQSGRSAMDHDHPRAALAGLPPARRQRAARLDRRPATPTSITMFTDLRDTSINAVGHARRPPRARSAGRTRARWPLTETPAGQETIWKPTAVDSGVYSFVDTGDATRDLLVNVQQATPDGQRRRADPDLPLLQVRLRDRRGAGTRPSRPNELIGTGTGGALQRRPRSSRSRRSRSPTRPIPPLKRADGRGSTVFTNAVFTRTVDPNADPDELSAAMHLTRLAAHASAASPCSS